MNYYTAAFDGRPSTSHSVVHVGGQALSIEWLPTTEVEAMRNS